VARKVREASGCELYALEPDHRRVQKARRESSAVHSEVGAAESIPFGAGFFDKSYSTMALHHFADQEAGVREVARVTRPGGLFVVLDVEPGTGRGRMFRFLENFVMRRKMRFLRQVEAVEVLEAQGDFKAVRKTSLGGAFLLVAERAAGPSTSSSGG